MPPGQKDRKPAPSDFPRTVDEAVHRLLRAYDEKVKAEVRRSAREDLFQFHHSLGQGIRNGFGLWGENKELLATLAMKDRWADNASMIIIEALWLRLREEA
jgi:hypothetical protein